MNPDSAYNHTDLDARFWNARYQSAQIGWDLGAISPPIKAYLNQLTDKSISILIPGCGNAYEAEYLLENGFTDVSLIDISKTLTDSLKVRLSSYLNKGLKIVTADFFDLEGQYDLIIEQTFFCALLPSLRARYVEKMHQLLKPGGSLVGVLFNREFEAGPPFGGSQKEYEELFKLQFELNVFNHCYNSVSPRADTELFINVKKPKN